MKEKPTFIEALKFWTKLGFISFGGPAGQIAIMHEYLVEKKKWISESKFMHALNYCMILPGPEAQQLATYIGWMLHGTRGGLAAGIMFVLPATLILLGFSGIYVTFGDTPWIYAMFSGLKPAVIAIVILALMKIGKKSLQSRFHYLVAIIAFVCIFFFNLPFPLIILGTVILAFIINRFYPRFISSPSTNKVLQETSELDYYINKNTVLPDIGFNPKRFWKQISIGGILWVMPFVLFFLVAADFMFWKKMFLFFTQAAFVTFGGAYSVLPYVAQMSVEKFHWLSNFQMIDGLALGETSPGPLIMVLVFVGFMGGYNHFGNSIAMGTIGLFSTVFYTFLPSFVFIFLGAPIIERTQENKKVKELLSLVTASVVGVILNLTFYLGKAVLFPKTFSIGEIDYITLCWIIISFIALYRFKLNIIVWVGISALYGLTRYLIF